MLDKFLKDVVAIVVGKAVEPVADLLNTNKHVNEFIIAKKLEITINQARNILYKLADHGLVSSIRKKDKKKGWYTYFWKMEIIKALEFLRNEKQKRLDIINNQINNRETKQFYICERCNIEVNEENALLYDFTCNECGDIFTIRDNTKLLKELKKNSAKFSNEVKLIEEELEKENTKVEKSKERKDKREKKKAKELRAQKAAERKKAKAKEEKKKPAKKKTVKKKTVKKVKKILKTVKKAAKKKIAKKKTVKKKPAKKKAVKKKPAKKPAKKKTVKKVKKTNTLKSTRKK